MANRKEWYKQKTTLTGLAAIGLAAAGFFTGGLTWPAALQLGMPGLLAIFLRQGVEGVKPAMIALLLIPALMIMPGCATMQQQAETANVPPPGCEDSLIYKHIPYPQVTDTVLQVAVYNFAEEVGGAKIDILHVIDKLDIILQPIEDGATTMNAAAFVAIVMQEVSFLNNRWGISLLIVSQSIETLNVPSPLTQCDARLIREHLAKQKQWVSMARQGE